MKMIYIGRIGEVSCIKIQETELSKFIDENYIVIQEDNIDETMIIQSDGTWVVSSVLVDRKNKIIKNKLLNNLTINHNTVAYDAHGKAIGNMAAVMGIANFKFNQAITIGTLLSNGIRQILTPEEAYQLIYKDTKIFWRGADDENHEVMIESVCETLEKSMAAVADIVVV